LKSIAACGDIPYNRRLQKKIPQGTRKDAGRIRGNKSARKAVFF
jgi:hypothetical protein